MSMERLGTFARNDRSQGYIQKIQSRAFELQTQISSGYKAQSYSGISKDAGRLVLLEADSARISQYEKTITQVDTRLNTMQVQMGSLLDNAVSLNACEWAEQRQQQFHGHQPASVSAP